jgi:oligopeptidase A
LRAGPASATYESTFLALETATEDARPRLGTPQPSGLGCDNPAQREALNKMLPEVTDFYSSLPLNERLWAVLKSVGESPAAAALDPDRKRFVEETLADFRQSGADLPADQKQRIAAIEAELSKLTKQYAEHVLDSTNAWELVITDESKLAGLPESAKAGAAATRAPRAWPPMTNPRGVSPCSFHRCSHHAAPARRRHPPPGLGGLVAGRKLWGIRQHPLVWQILELRHEKAAILGHSHFADLTCCAAWPKTGCQRARVHRKPPLAHPPGLSCGLPPARPIQGGQDRPARRCPRTLGSRLLGRTPAQGKLRSR